MSPPDPEDSDDEINGYVNHDPGSDYEIDTSKILYFYDIDPTKRRRKHMPSTVHAPSHTEGNEASDEDAPMARSAPIEPMRQILEPDGVPIFLHPSQAMDKERRGTHAEQKGGPWGKPHQNTQLDVTELICEPQIGGDDTPEAHAPHANGSLRGHAYRDMTTRQNRSGTVPQSEPQTQSSLTV